MLFESPLDRAFAIAISRLAHCNPFLPERMKCEREALGEEFTELDVVWSVSKDWEGDRANIRRIQTRAESLSQQLRQRLATGASPTDDDLRLYEDLAAYLLYYRVKRVFQEVVNGSVAKPRERIAELYDQFAQDAAHFLAIPGVKLPSGYQTPHLFAIFFQIRRAFHHIFRNIVGSSMPAARLRASIWQSIFTHDMARYRRLLFERMHDLTTLITGPSGTGKELVARAIALSTYLPFDPKNRAFADDFNDLFHPLNLSAMSPTLIESELFGHRRGAFTGALEDRIGWLEACQPLGTVFLDEIGELDPTIQVKLLRVLQTRTYQRLGDTRTREFKGKIIAATNRDLSKEMASGRFRSDFYYRICSDIIATPSLRDQLREASDDLRAMVLFIARRITGEEEAEQLADEVDSWVASHLGRNYPWPGNFRELEQCVRNVLIRHEYHPQAISSSDPGTQLVDAINAGKLTADDLLRRYCTLVYSRTRNLEETARRLALDRRTVKSKVDPEILSAVRGVAEMVED